MFAQDLKPQIRSETTQPEDGSSSSCVSPSSGFVDRLRKDWEPVNCPAGLEFLCFVDKLTLSRTAPDHFNVACAMTGRILLSAVGQSDKWTDYLVSAGQNRLLHFNSVGFAKGWLEESFEKCEMRLEGSEEVLGIVKPRTNWVRIKSYELTDAQGTVQLYINAPHCVLCCGSASKLTFEIVGSDRAGRVGFVQRQKSPNQNSQVFYHLYFPLDLSAQYKALVICNALMLASRQGFNTTSA